MPTRCSGTWSSLTGPLTGDEPDRLMRIGIVCPYDLGTSGGVQQLSIELAERLRRAGDEVKLVGPGRNPTSIRTGGVIRVRANRSAVSLSISPATFPRMRRLLSQADVVHVHEPFIPLTGWAGLSLGRPTVATFHADPAGWARWLYRAAAPLGAGALSGAVLTAASPVAASALPAEWGEVEVIPNAIDVASYHLPVERVAKRVVFLGRDDRRKGLSVLLAAWPAVRRRHPEAELVVMGARRPPIEGVDFRGPVSEEEKRTTLASAAVMVAPNLGGESFGIVLAEAMAAGCAVVASDLPAFRAVLGDSGRMVPPGDDGALADALTGMLDRPAHTASLGEAARRSSRRFDWSRVVSLYRAAYESAVDRAPTTIHPRKE